MELRTLLTALVVPPPGLLYLAVLGLVMRGRRRRVGTALAAVAVGGLIVLGTPTVGEALLVSLERGLPTVPATADPPQAIVILSGDVERIGEPPGAEVGPLTLQRLLAAVRLWQRVHLPILVSGGRLRTGETPVASLMAETLEHDFHVPVRWVEEHSLDTWQNAADSAAMLAPEGIRSVYVVTHAWHERRALPAFRHFGLIPTAAPVPLDRVVAGVLPGIGGWSRSYDALHEWIGCAVYAVRARLAGPAVVPSNRAA
ncbi:MAG: YdcF family protein [Pseudomonadota bacterium]|nr:YdcF family protein [Pseudomonadota bacterium]